MRPILALLYSLLLAIGRKSSHWYIDGNNLLGHGKTAKDRDALIQTLRHVPAGDVMTLVLDGRLGIQQTSIHWEKNLCTVDLREGLVSDDYIHDEIQKLWKDPSTRKKNRVNLVSADRKLRQRALQFKPIVRTVVNPLVFFRRYLPRLNGWKKNRNLSSSDEAD